MSLSPPPTALLFESVRNPKEDHKLKPLKTDILLDDAFDFETSIAISWQIVPGHFLVTLIRLAFLFTNSMSQCLSYCALDSCRYKSWDT